MIKLTMSLLASALVLAGCSSTPTAQDTTKDQLKAEQLKADAAQEKAEKHIANVPEWVLKQPKPDATGVYGVGQGESKKLDIAMKKANLNAQFELAKHFAQELSGNEQSYAQENNAGVSEQYTQLIDNIVDSVPVNGYSVVSQEIVAIDGKYSAFLLLKLPYEEFNAVLEKQKSQAKSAEIKQAFSDLEKRLEKRAQTTSPSKAMK